MRWHVGVTLGAAVAGMLSAGMAWGQVPATAPAAGTRWEAVLRGLQSEAFAEREAAQKSLEGATWRDLETLRGLMKGASDPEVKARLQKRLDAVELEWLTHPPAVTLEVQRAGIQDVAGALSAGTGVAWVAEDSGKPDGAWTMKAAERPLWEVFLALENQSPLHLQESAGKEVVAAGRRARGGVGPLEAEWKEAAAGDFLMYAGVVRGEEPRVKVACGVRGDPRLRLVWCGVPQIDSVVDDRGATLYAGKWRDDWMTGGGAATSEMDTTVLFADSPAIGGKVTITGWVPVRRATAIERVEVRDFTNKQGKAVVVGGRTWQFWAQDLARDGWALNVIERRSGGMPAQSVPLAVRVVDTLGKVVWEGALDRQMAVRVQPGAVKGPLVADILVARESRDEVVKFEIHQVAVPVKGGAATQK